VSSLWSRALYFFRAALRGMRASRLTTAVATATIALALVPAGLFLLITGNMSSLLARVGGEMRITAFLAPDLPADDARALATELSSLEDVERVEVVTPEQALARFRRRLGGAGLLEGLEDNPLPPSLEITLSADHRSVEAARRVTERLRAQTGVEEVVGGEGWIEGYARALSLVRGAGLVLGGVLGAATLLIVANTIRLAVYARRDELDILALVGGSRTFLRVPFLIEGAIQGAVGGAIALLLLAGIFHLAIPQLGDALELFLGWSDPQFLSLRSMLALVGAGAGFGLAGAAAAVAGSRLT
jgi:cell division transport system permease protein